MRLFSAFALSVALVVTGCYDDSELREQMNNQQAEMNAALQELRAADAELNGLVSAIAARVAELEATVDGIETSVGNLGTEVDNLETEVGGIKTDMEDIDTGLSELENSINALQNRVSQLENRVPDTGNTGEGGSGETGGNYAEQIAAMQKELADLKSAVQSSMDMYSKLESNMTGLQEMLNMHDWNLNDVKQRLESCEAFMAEFNDFKAWVQTELDLIKADIESIKQSLLELIAADANLNGLISVLDARVEQLEAEIAALKNAESGDNGGTVTPPDNSQVEDLVARVAALEQELATINTALESLRTKDGELEEAINSLAAIVASNKAEAETTFADLAEFNALKEAVEALEDEYAAEFGLIKSDINTIKETLTSLEDADETLEGLIAALQQRAAEIEKSIVTLKQSITDDIDALEAKIAKLNTELEAVNTAIAELKAKDSETDAAIASLRAALEAHEAAVEQTLAEYLADVQGISNDFTALLNQHIQLSDTAFTRQTEAINALTKEIAAMKEQYEAEFNLIKKDIEDIVAMIQSMTNISPYSDGSASANYYTDESNENLNLAIMECNYIVRPAGAAEKLASAWAENKDIMQFRAHYTMTRAAFDFVDVEIKDVAAEGDILTVTGYVDGISNAWIKGQESFSASLLVTDGKTDYCTDFVNVAAADRETDLSAEETANCYMVHERGNYRFKYHRRGTPHSAEVLWESLGTNLVSEVGCLIAPDVEIRNGNVYFKTNDTYSQGNAVIAVRDAEGTILWSWHIWMTDYPGSHDYKNNTGTIMAVNLGAVDGNESGLLYQWGRKDPFIGSFIHGSSSIKVTSTIEWPAAVKSDAGTGSVSYATKNPTVFITKNDLNDSWKYTGTEYHYDPEWNGMSGSEGLKTDYDPCPPGWKVPAGNKVDNLGSITTNSIWSSTYGFDFTASYSTIYLNCYEKFVGEQQGTIGDYYYFCGYLSEDDGTLMGLRSSGYYWTTNCLSFSDKGGYNCLIVDSSTHSATHMTTAISGARGASVRCVKK